MNRELTITDTYEYDHGATLKVTCDGTIQIDADDVRIDLSGEDFDRICESVDLHRQLLRSSGITEEYKSCYNSK